MLAKNFKLLFVLLFAAAVFFYGTPRQTVHANLSGPPASRTGAPSELTCAISGCHNTFTLNTGGGSVAISGLPDNYTADTDYDVTVSVTFAGRSRFGFQVTAIDDQGRSVGTLTATDATRTQIINGTIGGNLRRYVQHRQNGVSQSSWTFRWKSPAASTGRVTFYAAGNATNSNGGDDGDYIYTTSKAVQPPAAIAVVTTVSAASFASNSVLTANSLGALFGTNLASGLVIASTNPLPTTLGGVTVKIKDALGTERDAQLLVVSSGQINLLVPDGTANGTANVTVIRDGSTVGQGTITIETISLGLFAANASGTGTAAAEVLRVKPNGTLVYEPVVFINTAGALQAIPINFGPAEDQVFLILYGTGFRANTGVSNTSCTIGGETAEVLYAGTQNGLAGLDQANVRLPRTLAGRGVVNIVFTVAGKTANTVTITMQ